MSERKIERVARALCNAAGRNPRKEGGIEVIPERCVCCDNGQCQIWATFKNEAIAAMRAMKGFAI